MSNKGRWGIFIAAMLLVLVVMNTSVLGSKPDEHSDKKKQAETTDIMVETYEETSDVVSSVEFDGAKLVIQEVSKKEHDDKALKKKEKIEKMSGKEKEDLEKWKGDAFGSYPRKNAELLGELPPEATRLTLAEAKDIIASHNFETAGKKLLKIHGLPDFVGGSGIMVAVYNLDEEGNEGITVDIQNKQFIYRNATENIVEVLPGKQ